MAPPTFSVSEVRVAATCPRIAYFDAEHTRRNALKTKSITRLWKAGDAETACGSLFHHAVESFNARAGARPEILAAFENERDPRVIERVLRRFLNLYCINREVLARKPPAQQQGFVRALDVYMGELADIVAGARNRGHTADEVAGMLFGDRRRQADVTFQVGPAGEMVHVKGRLDYVFYDWRSARHRIIDYKLTPAAEPSNDLFQVGLYALMHAVQHRTEPDVAVLYLHPERKMVELPWEQVHGQRHKVFDLLASLADWVRYDEARGAGLKPPGEPSQCALCKWDRNGQCARRLGPKHEGLRHRHWSDGATAGAAHGPGPAPPGPQITVNPVVVVQAPAAIPTPTRPVARRPSPAPPTGAAVPAAIAPPDQGEIRPGATADGDQPVGIPLSALNTHVAVVGAAGSGKTWMAKVLAEEAIRLGVPALAIDPQGDLVQFLRPSPRAAGLPEDHRPACRDYLDRVEPRIWTPGTSHARRLSLDPIRLPSATAWEAIDAEDREALLIGAAAHLVGLAGAGGETDSQQTIVLQVLRRLLATDGGPEISLASITAALFDPGAVGLDEPDRFVRKADRERLARRLNGLQHGPAAGLYSGGQRLDIDAMRQPDAPGKTPLNVVYLNALADDQKRFVVATIASEIYRWMVSAPGASGGRPQLLVYLDEARDYIPAGTRQTAAKAPLIRLVAQGRKYGVGVLVCTQSPRSVDYNVFGNCSTKLIGRLESAQDADRVAEWFTTEGGRPPWLPGRAGAAAGTFVGRWPGMPPSLEGRALRSRPLFSLHEGAWSPDRLAHETTRDPAGPPP